jgi:hypothetical protein
MQSKRKSPARERGAEVDHVEKESWRSHNFFCCALQLASADASALT